MTKLFNDIIFGPVLSRRLGVSLGVNLLPSYSKLCNFDCIYCECGWNADNRGDMRFNSREEVYNALREKLETMREGGEMPDVITFAGNGEPTLSPWFEEIIDDTLSLRDLYAPNAKVSVLSNATMLHKESVVRALKRVDNNILKLDSALDTTARAMNNPSSRTYSPSQVARQMASFEGDVIVQTMFLRGVVNGVEVDNTTPEEISAWVDVVSQVAPKQVMIYSIDRDTPCKTLEKISREELLVISQHIEKLGIDIVVA